MSNPGEALPQFPPAEVLTPPEPPAATERLYDRRDVLRLFGGAAAVGTVAAIGIELVAPEQAVAQTDQSDDKPDKPLTPEERAKIEAETRELESRARLNEIQIREAERRLDPPFLEWLQKGFGGFVAAGAGGGVIALGFSGLRNHFRAKKEEQRQEDERLRQAEQKLRKEEQDQLTEARKGIVDALKYEAPQERPADYKLLAEAYSRLKRFTGSEHLAPEVFTLCVSFLRARASEVSKPPLTLDDEHTKARENADRYLVVTLSEVASSLPRANSDGNSTLPDASGISLSKLRQLRWPLERVNLTGAYLDDLLITGSLRGSLLAHAHLERAVFGGSNSVGDWEGVCDLRDTDLSQAFLTHARFDNVLINAGTKFGEGHEGDPRATFGTVISYDLEPEEVEAKVVAAKAVIEQWEQTHPEATATH